VGDAAIASWMKPTTGMPGVYAKDDPPVQMARRGLAGNRVTFVKVIQFTPLVEKKPVIVELVGLRSIRNQQLVLPLLISMEKTFVPAASSFMVMTWPLSW